MIQSRARGMMTRLKLVMHKEQTEKYGHYNWDDAKEKVDSTHSYIMDLLMRKVY